MELYTGMPFMGPSGKMLAQTLSAVGFDSLGVEPYILNALSCFPRGKDLGSLTAGTHACRGRVIEQVSAHPRKAILALGNAAMWAVTGDFGLKSLKDRGRVIETAMGPAVLASHPAYILRNGQAYSVWKKDLKQAVAIAKGTKPNEWTPPTWHVVERPSEYIALVDEYLDSGEMITGDVETDAFHWFDGRILCLGITKGDGSHVDIIPENLLYNMPRTTKKLVEGGRWNWHNGLFDIKWFRRMGWEAKVDEDTMLLSYALNENGGFHDLDQVAQHWIKAPKHKNMLDAHKSPGWKSYRDFPPKVLYEYNAIDLSKTHRMHAPLREAVAEDPHLEKLYTKTLIPANDFLAEMQLYGIELDEKKVWENHAQHLDELAGIDEQIQALAEKHLGKKINIASPLQLKELLYGKLGYGPMSRSTNKAALEEIQRRYDSPPVIDLLLKRREVAKRDSTYVINLVDHEVVKAKGRKIWVPGKVKADGRIHADYALHKTSTGRLAGSEPNMLNQPRGPIIRSQYKARKGKILGEVDLNQAELRSLALMSGDPVLTEIYTKNEVSIHDVTTAAFYASKADVMKGEGAYERVRRMLHLDQGADPSFVYGQAKMRGKAVNFGIVYGREAFSLAKEFDIPVAEAQRWIDTWFETYAGAAEFIQWCRTRPAEGRTLITNFGRKKRFGVVNYDNLQGLQNEAANFPHQSTASDIMLHVAMEVHREMVRRWDSHIWNEVYDAIYFEMDDDDVALQECIAYVQEVITRVPLDWGLTAIPFLGDAKVGYTWGSMKDWKGSTEASLGYKLAA